MTGPDGSILVLPEYQADTERLIEQFNATAGVEVSFYRTHTSNQFDRGATFNAFEQARKAYNRKIPNHRYHIKTQHRSTLEALVGLYLTLAEGGSSEYAELDSRLEGVGPDLEKMYWHRFRLNMAKFFPDIGAKDRRTWDGHIKAWEKTGRVRRLNVKQGRHRRHKELSSEVWLDGSCLKTYNS